MGAPPLSDDEWQRTLKALEDNNWIIKDAAESLNQPRKTISARVNVARRKGLIAVGHPLSSERITGRSTLYRGEETVLEWVKTSVDEERLENIAHIIADALGESLPAARPTDAPLTSVEDQLSCYMLGDCHLGLYAWGEQTGSDGDFDTIIAQRDLVGAANTLIRAAPASRRALIVNLGDYFHADSQAGETPKSKHRLDTDTRWAQVIKVGVKVQTYMIDRALEKHETVEYVPVAGNHDPNAAIMFGEIIAAYYRNEPRVNVDLRPKSFRHIRFGNNLIGLCHGDGGKPEEYAGQLAVEAREDWGQCDFRYVWHGHLHHRRMIEKLGCVVECFRTLAARDQWHAHNGYLAGREMQLVILHKDVGEIGRAVASLKRIREDHGKEASN